MIAMAVDVHVCLDTSVIIVVVIVPIIVTTFRLMKNI